jgi:hypothetical protein
MSIYPCSIFAYRINGEMYFCANEDWTAADPSILAIKPAKGKYGVVLLGWNTYLPNYPQAGVNSEGLCFDWATVPKQPYKYSENKEEFDINSTIQILQKCKNIEEAIQLISNTNFPHLAEEHIMLCDINNSCVIEYTKGKLKIVKLVGNSQYITNFNLTDKEAGWYPCTRFSKIEKMLSQKNLQEKDFIYLLNDVHQEENYPTQYSYIINLSELTVKLFINHDYQSSQIFSIKKLLEKNQKIALKK